MSEKVYIVNNSRHSVAFSLITALPTADNKAYTTGGVLVIDGLNKAIERDKRSVVVDSSVWEHIAKHYSNTPAIKNGLIFAEKLEAKAESRAKEEAKTVHEIKDPAHPLKRKVDKNGEELLINVNKIQRDGANK